MSTILPLLANANALPANVSGWVVNAGKAPTQTPDGYQTHSFTVTGPKGTVYLIDLYTKGNHSQPHGWEATKADTDSETGYYSTGGLTIRCGQLDDYDGVACLPRPVCALLRALHVTVSDNCLAVALDGTPL